MAAFLETEEEALRQACASRLSADAFFSALPELRILSRVEGDIPSLVDSLLASIGAAVIVRTPIPVRADTRTEAPRYTAFAVQVLVLSMPTIAAQKELPSGPRIAREVERALHGFVPSGIFPTSHPRPWRLRLDGEQPREDQSPDDMTLQYLCRFVFSQEA